MYAGGAAVRRPGPAAEELRGPQLAQHLQLRSTLVTPYTPYSQLWSTLVTACGLTPYTNTYSVLFFALACSSARVDIECIPKTHIATYQAVNQNLDLAPAFDSNPNHALDTGFGLDLDFGFV
ncbi:hypothetical protein EVAR_98859_1 [Eumeta japonica]|uniref:Uncharacterized protein n=1 Tax=Eumeta variegata TaxID=151549 RepID=A0A4C1Z8T4_EUMVA|nr:hypothetical protein EVAR_98859_1 [Eumeta japonica]